MGEYALGGPKLRHSPVCKRCGLGKVAQRIRKREDGTSYKTFYCAPCSTSGTRKYREMNAAKRLWSSAKSRAAQIGVDFNLEPEDIVVPALCPIFRIPLSHTYNRRHDGTPSIDRINPRRGYVRGNIVVISWRANRLKNNATTEELRALADFYC
jgi:hypothetical protein